MPNKFFLRSDRTAVKPDENHLKAFNETLPQSLDEVQKWNDELADYLLSLPGLPVEPSFLATLKPGWFEGVERYEVRPGKNWVSCSKERYDDCNADRRRLTIIAPQEAEKGDEGEARDSLRYLLNKSAENPKMQVGTLLDKRFNMNMVTVRDHLEELWDITAPATPQPVTGEVGESLVRGNTNKYVRDNKGSGKLPQPEYTVDISNDTAQKKCDELLPMQEFYKSNIEMALDQAKRSGFVFGYTQAASRPTDAVEFAEWLAFNEELNTPL